MAAIRKRYKRPSAPTPFEALAGSELRDAARGVAAAIDVPIDGLGRGSEHDDLPLSRRSGGGTAAAPHGPSTPAEDVDCEISMEDLMPATRGPPAIDAGQMAAIESFRGPTPTPVRVVTTVGPPPPCSVCGCLCV